MTGLREKPLGRAEKLSRIPRPQDPNGTPGMQRRATDQGVGEIGGSPWLPQGSTAEEPARGEGQAGQTPGHAQVVSVNLAWGFILVPTASQLTGPPLIHPDVSAASSSLKSHQQGRPEPSPSLRLTLAGEGSVGRGTSCPRDLPHSPQRGRDTKGPPSPPHCVLNQD